MKQFKDKKYDKKNVIFKLKSQRCYQCNLPAGCVVPPNVIPVGAPAVVCGVPPKENPELCVVEPPSENPDGVAVCVTPPSENPDVDDACVPPREKPDGAAEACVVEPCVLVPKEKPEVPDAGGAVLPPKLNPAVPVDAAGCGVPPKLKPADVPVPVLAVGVPNENPPVHDNKMNVNDDI